MLTKAIKINWTKVTRLDLNGVISHPTPKLNHYSRNRFLLILWSPEWVPRGPPSSVEDGDDIVCLTLVTSRSRDSSPSLVMGNAINRDSPNKLYISQHGYLGSTLRRSKTNDINNVNLSPRETPHSVGISAGTAKWRMIFIFTVKMSANTSHSLNRMRDFCPAEGGAYKQVSKWG